MADPTPQIRGPQLPWRNSRDFLAAIWAFSSARGDCFTAHGTELVVAGCHAGLPLAEQAFGAIEERTTKLAKATQGPI